MFKLVLRMSRLEQATVRLGLARKKNLGSSQNEPSHKKFQLEPKWAEPSHENSGSSQAGLELARAGSSFIIKKTFRNVIH